MFEEVRIKFNGVLWEIPVRELDINAENPNDAEVRVAMAERLGVDSLDEFVVQRENTVINLRPTASFGAN